MSFSSIVFLAIFLPVTLLGYYIFFFSKTLQRIWLLLASLIFYGFGTLVGLAIVLGMLALDGILGLVLGSLKEGGGKWLFGIGIICNLFPVAFFKYIYEQGSLLPIGISFVTLSGISYLSDVYSRETKAVKNPVMLGLYFLHFPKLLAGPVMKFREFREQLESRKLTLRRSAVGCCRFVTGLAKKVLLADTLAQLADVVFNYSAMGRETVMVPVIMAWMGLFAFTMQIYFDISGYADMAIGLGLMFGIMMEENVDYPYMAVSVSDFWDRFYISLMKWFRQYVYEPLGGGRQKNMDKMVVNLFFMWLVLGMWYGIGGRFILWALWQFVFILAERFLGFTENNPHTALLRIYTLAVIIFGWVLFRAPELYQAGRFYMNMFGANYNGVWNSMTGLLLKEYWVYLIVGGFFCTPVARKVNTWLVKGEKGRVCKAVVTVCYPVVLAVILLLCFSYMLQGLGRPFLYSLF